MSGLTTHVLDAVDGGGAVGVGLTVHRRDEDGIVRVVATGETDANGRAALLEPDALAAGLYEIGFATLAWQRSRGRKPFFEDVVVRFRVAEAGGSYHLPIVLAPATYAVYRGGVPPSSAAALPPELSR